MRIAIVATGGRVKPEIEDLIQSLVAADYADRAEVVFHPQCFETSGHFAGDDVSRLNAFCDCANDPSFDAIWFARGGYGSIRIATEVLPRLNQAARNKSYLGYSDAGCMLALLYREKIGKVFHAPMPADWLRDKCDATARRVLDFLVSKDQSSLEPSVDGKTPTAAFNLMIFSQLIGTSIQPDLSGHIVMLEEVAEYHYRIDRALAHVALSGALKGAKGLRLGRCTQIPENDPSFDMSPEEMARYWCQKADIPFLGNADIGHDVENKIVPFGI
jgi:muramoyltetrapeptide carboxypeptidase